MYTHGGFAQIMAFLAGERAELAAVTRAQVDDHAPGMLGGLRLRDRGRRPRRDRSLCLVPVVDHGQGAAGRRDAQRAEDVAAAQHLVLVRGGSRRRTCWSYLRERRTFLHAVLLQSRSGSTSLMESPELRRRLRHFSCGCCVATW